VTKDLCLNMKIGDTGRTLAEGERAANVVLTFSRKEEVLRLISELSDELLVFETDRRTHPMCVAIDGVVSEEDPTPDSNVKYLHSHVLDFVG